MAEKENIHSLKDMVGEAFDKLDSAEAKLNETREALTAEQVAQKQSIQEQRDLLENINARLDKLDKELPQGDKFYRPADGEDAKVAKRQRLGEMVVDIFQEGRGKEEKFGFMTQIRSQTEATDADGGYLVPEEQSNEIIKLVSNFGFARRECRVMPMTRSHMRLPVSTYGPSVLVDDWMDFASAAAPGSKEAQTGFNGSAQFSRPELIAARLLAYDDISLEVAEDSSPSLMAFLVDVFAEAIALAEDRQVLSASARPFTGVLHETGVGAVTLLASQSHSFVNITYDNLVDVYNAADEKTQENGIWVMSAFAFNQMRKLKDTTNRPLFNHENPLVTGMGLQLLGRPVRLSTVMPKAAQQTTGQPLLCYGDFGRYAIFGDRKRVSMDVSPHVNFKSGQLTMRFMERFAVKIVVPAAFSKLKAA